MNRPTADDVPLTDGEIRALPSDAEMTVVWCGKKYDWPRSGDYEVFVKPATRRAAAPSQADEAMTLWGGMSCE